MRYNSIALVLCGAIGGVAFVVSCGDDGPPTVDAAIEQPDAPPAVCDCPAAEKPLAGRFETVVRTDAVAAMRTGASFARCPAGATVISGGCSIVGAQVLNVTLTESTPRPVLAEGWSCIYRNDEVSTAITIEAKVLCLKPSL